jgi:hypothetical protein
VAADFFIAAPELDFSITELEDVLGLAVFGIVGSFVALMIDEFLSFPGLARRKSFVARLLRAAVKRGTPS